MKNCFLACTRKVRFTFSSSSIFFFPVRSLSVQSTSISSLVSEVLRAPASDGEQSPEEDSQDENDELAAWITSQAKSAEALATNAASSSPPPSSRSSASPTPSSTAPPSAPQSQSVSPNESEEADDDLSSWIAQQASEARKAAEEEEQAAVTSNDDDLSR